MWHTVTWRTLHFPVRRPGVGQNWRWDSSERVLCDPIHTVFSKTQPNLSLLLNEGHFFGRWLDSILGLLEWHLNELKSIPFVSTLCCLCCLQCALLDLVVMNPLSQKFQELEQHNGSCLPAIKTAYICEYRQTKQRCNQGVNNAVFGRLT